MKNKLLMLATVLIGTFAHQSHAIINGTTVTSSDIAAQSTVAILENGVWICTGTLIRRNAVLTAAHCSWPGTVGAVRFGLNGKDQSAVTIGATVHIHPLYDPARISNDLAVFILDTDAPSGFTPANLMTYAGDIAHNDKVLSVGYGRTVASKSSSGDLNQAVVSVLHNQYENTYFTMKQGPYGICFGDSGGPAYDFSGSTLTVVGVASAVINYQCKGYGYFENVGHHREWIESIR